MQKLILKKPKLKDNIKKKTEKSMCMSQHTFEPVSYTHLTLPTNREV